MTGALERLLEFAELSTKGKGVRATKQLVTDAAAELEQLRHRLAAAEVATLQALLDEIDGSVYVEVWDYIKQKRDAAALSEREPVAQPSERTAEQRCKKHSVVYCAECYPAVGVKTRRR